VCVTGGCGSGGGGGGAADASWVVIADLSFKGGGPAGGEGRVGRGGAWDFGGGGGGCDDGGEEGVCEEGAAFDDAAGGGGAADDDGAEEAMKLPATEADGALVAGGELGAGL
jgi:hypothetical protein